MRKTTLDMLQLGNNSVLNGVKTASARLLERIDQNIKPLGPRRRYIGVLQEMVAVRYVYDRCRKAASIHSIAHTDGGRAHQTTRALYQWRMSLHAALRWNERGGLESSAVPRADRHRVHQNSPEMLASVEAPKTERVRKKNDHADGPDH